MLRPVGPGPSGRRRQDDDRDHAHGQCVDETGGDEKLQRPVDILHRRPRPAAADPGIVDDGTGITPGTGQRQAEPVQVGSKVSMAFVYFFHPGMRELLMGEKWFSYLSLAGGSFIAVDAFFSFRAMERVMERLSYIFNNYLELTTQELQELLNSMKRQLAAFNSLRRILSRSMGEGIEKKLPQPLKKLLGTLENKAIDQRFNDLEYLEIVADILSNEDFLKLKEFPHHDATIYDHVRKVSYLSYRLCRNLNLDYRSAARGGLLHDFFLYDWKDSGPRPYRGGLHGFKHPRVALLNSMTHFNLNDIEYDIILKHMWPLTIKPPQYRESYIVSMVDKYISSGEFFNGVYQLPRRIREKKTSML